MKNLRQEIREGKTPENCATCWIDEDNGKESKRELYNGYAEWRYPNGINYDEEPDMPKDYQLILVDGPSGKSGRSGLLANISLFRYDVPIILDDTIRSDEANIARELAFLGWRG